MGKEISEKAMENLCKILAREIPKIEAKERQAMAESKPA